MKFFTPVGVLVILLFFALPVFAEDAVKFRISEWDTNFNMDLAVSQDYLPATKISASMLGLRNDHYVPSLELIFYQYRFKMTFGYWEAMYKGTEQLALDVDFEGTTFSLNDLVRTKLKITSYDIRAQLNFISMSKAEIGIIGGVRVLYYYAGIQDFTSNFAASDDAYAGAPYVGGAAEFVFQNQFVFGANIVSFSYTNEESEFKLNKYLDVNFYVELRIGSNIAARAGYCTIDMSFEKTGADGFNMVHYIKGPYFGIYIAF